MIKHTQRILNHLKTQKKITSFEAFELYGITRLSAVIYSLRKRYGYNITNKNLHGKNRYGESVHFVEYILEDA